MAENPRTGVIELESDPDGLVRRYLADFNSRMMKWITTDVLVIGSGIAGLRAALAAAEMCEVTLVAKEQIVDTNTWRAQGGIAAAIGADDTVESHIADTLASGKGLCDEGVVRTVIGEGPAAIREFIAWGGNFDRADSGEIDFTREGGHSASRVLHAGGDGTGEEIERTLVRKVREKENIRILEHFYVIDLYTEGGACLGAIGYSDRYGMTRIAAAATVLASGGAGRVFRESTNAHIATGDGIAMAYRAGCEVRDMEFIQFHPTTLYIAGAERVLITEAARGEGGVLVNVYGRRFMFDYHPKGELAPRDIVSQAVVVEMRKTNDTSVYLDLTKIGSEKVADRFPHLVRLCRNFGLDPAEDVIPVRPSAHYTIGGVRIDADGRTGVDRLFAAGETAASGFHGANRLGSNSLLEGLVIGKRAGAAAGEGALSCGTISFDRSFECTGDKSAIQEHIDAGDVRNAVRSLMWRKVGIERVEEGLAYTGDKLAFWRRYVLPAKFNFPFGWVLQNMLITADLMVRAALERRESRGVHRRLDFPDRKDDNFLRSISFRKRNTGI